MDKYIELRDVSKLITKGTTPTTIGEGFKSSGTNFIKAECLDRNKFINIHLASFISTETHQSLKRSWLKENDLLFSIAGHLGKIAIVRRIDLPANTNQALAIIRLDANLYSVDFLYYYISLNEIQNYINSQCAQSVQPNINLEQVGDLLVPNFPLTTQKKIAAVLSAFDDKIELNNQINAELEEMAKTLYDYWFVQFDFPDENGKPYKSSGGKMVYDEVLKREIPEGWEVKKVSSLLEVKDGTHASPKYILKNGYPLVTSKNLKSSGIDFSETNLIAKSDYDAINLRSKVDTGDILFSMIGNIGTIYKVEEDKINFAIKNVALFKTSTKPEYKNFLYQYLHGYDMQRYMPLVISGSIQKFIGLNSLRAIPILFNKETINAYSTLTEVIYLRMNNILLQNQQLAQLRDWLLPMLMNGQVTVGEAEGMVNGLGMVAEERTRYD